MASFDGLRMSGLANRTRVEARPRTAGGRRTVAPDAWNRLVREQGSETDVGAGFDGLLMGVDVVGVLYCEPIALKEYYLRGLAGVLHAHGWTYNVVCRDGHWRDDVDDWTFEDAPDEEQDDRKLRIAIRNVVEAGGGALSFSRELPAGAEYASRVSVRPSTDGDFWTVKWTDSAVPYTGAENRANQRLAVDLFADMAAHVAPYVGALGLRPGPVGGEFRGDFSAPPEYVSGVTYLSDDVPGVPVSDLRASRVPRPVVELQDGVLFEPGGSGGPWHCREDDAERLETVLGIEYRRQ